MVLNSLAQRSSSKQHHNWGGHFWPSALYTSRPRKEVYKQKNKNGAHPQRKAVRDVGSKQSVSWPSNFSLVRPRLNLIFCTQMPRRLPIKYSPPISLNFYSLNNMISKNKILYSKNPTKATKIQI